MFFFIIPSGESYCNDRSKEFSENKNIYERRTFYYGNYKNHAASCRQRPHRESGDQAKPFTESCFVWRLTTHYHKVLLTLKNC